MIEFTREWRNYNAGDKAVFSDKTEEHLVKIKVGTRKATVMKDKQINKEGKNPSGPVNKQTTVGPQTRS